MPTDHWLYLEEQQENGEWVFTRRISCTCHVNENHWTERPSKREAA